MLESIHPKLPMRDSRLTKLYYTSQLGFHLKADFSNYLILEKDKIEIHFFEHKSLDPSENYGQVYFRTKKIEQVYHGMIHSGVEIHPNGHLELKPWGQKEFSLLDPDNNLLTFGEGS
jgi:hypothetical protein